MGSGGMPVQIRQGSDPLGGVVTIPMEHHEIHEGHSFTALHVRSGTPTTGALLEVVAPASGDIHAVFLPEANAESVAYLYEGQTSSAGTAVTAYNRDRNSTTAATLTAVHTPTVATTGSDILCAWNIGSSGIGGARGSGTGARGNEFILKASTKYLLKVMPTASGATCILSVDWYEET